MIDPRLFDAVLREHQHQRDKHGPQMYPNGTGDDAQLWVVLDQIRSLVSLRTDMGVVTWNEVLLEEYLEVANERDPEKLKKELIQVATVALAWATKLDNPHDPAI